MTLGTSLMAASNVLMVVVETTETTMEAMEKEEDSTTRGKETATEVVSGTLRGRKKTGEAGCSAEVGRLKEAGEDET